MQTFTAWSGPHKSCRIPKHTTHTCGSTAAEPVGSSLALLQGGSSTISVSSDLFSRAKTWSVESWTLLASFSVMKAWSSLRIACVKWKKKSTAVNCKTSATAACAILGWTNKHNNSCRQKVSGKQQNGMLPLHAVLVYRQPGRSRSRIWGHSEHSSQLTAASGRWVYLSPSVATSLQAAGAEESKLILLDHTIFIC